jgi:gliding motility-associated-like protein
MQAGDYEVKLTVTGDDNAQRSMTKIVTVTHAPQAGFEVSADNLWVGSPLHTINYSRCDADVWYLWDWGDGRANDTSREPSHYYLAEGTYSITLTVGTYSDPECISTVTLPDAISLRNAGDIILPNVFIPDKTGEPSDVVPNSGYKNYLFYAPVLAPTKKYKMTIFNRWGIKLYETEDPTRGWNGYYRGRLSDEGVYMYRIEGVFETGQPFFRMGDITLLN